MGDKTKIDWCDASWNPVTGCLHGCEYCYARRVARRYCSNEHGHEGTAAPCTGDCKFCSELDGPEFLDNSPRWNHNPSAIYPFGFWPTFHPHRLDFPSRLKRPRTIFVCSMADLFGDWVPDEWIQEVFDACLAAPQHRYLFLTKNPRRYIELAEKGMLPKEENFWYGSTATIPEMPFFYCKGVNVFLSVEPILAPFGNLGNQDSFVNWIIVGAETGNRKNKVVPQKAWIDELSEQCRRTGTPIFMKESLRGIMDEDFRQEYPWR